MENPRLLYGIGIIVGFSIVVGFASYTFPTHTPKQQALTEMSIPQESKTTLEGTTTRIATAPKLEGCGCCAKRRARLKKHRLRARERKLAKEKIVKTVLP